MKSSIVMLVLFLISISLCSQPRPVKLSSTIIIDTDCGIDDMRAISLLLARPEITVKAVLTSDGSLSPEEGAEKVLSLLHEFRREEIPVVCGKTVKGINPAWRPFCNSISWGSQSGSSISGINSADYLSKVLEHESGKITLVCLGPLTNIWGAIEKNTNEITKVDRIIWYNEAINPLQGFNYECDKVSANALFNLNIRIDIISNLGLDNSFFDTSMYSLCKQSKTDLARILNNVFIQPQVQEKLNENHFRLCDDLVALYITNPELFGINTNLEKLNIRYNKEYDVQEVRQAIGDMITGVYVREHNIVFNRFPAEHELFNYDIRPIIDSAIARYGNDEWKANVMTDEFHGHLGVFSIVGAKMGIKAREILGAGPDMLEVVAYAGTKPPYSCLTDGIQASTGATLGMGTIHLAKHGKTKPSAIFTYGSRSVRISLKKEYLERIDADIKEGIIKFGLMDDGYWKLIRHNALKYWIEWDRNKIFDVEELHQKK